MELFHSLRKDSFQSLSRQSIARIFRELFPAELEVVIIIEFPELDINDVEVLITKEIRIFIDVRLSFDVNQALKNVGVPKLSTYTQNYL